MRRLETSGRLLFSSFGAHNLRDRPAPLRGTRPDPRGDRRLHRTKERPAARETAWSLRAAVHSTTTSCCCGGDVVPREWAPSAPPVNSRLICGLLPSTSGASIAPPPPPPPTLSSRAHTHTQRDAGTRHATSQLPRDNVARQQQQQRGGGDAARGSGVKAAGQ